MARNEKVMVTEHIFEVRHGAVGSFLDVRGYVADYIRDTGFLPHWKIDTNVVSFRDKKGGIEKEGAFAGYKSYGYFTYNPPTKNFFQDRANSFVKFLLKNKDYTIPSATRFGCRSKIFIPFEKDFETLNKLLNENFVSNKLRDIIACKETDMQIILEYKDKKFNSRLRLGPMHKDETKDQMSFESEHFSKVGLYLDIDYFIIDKIENEKIKHTLIDAMNLIWEKVENITKTLGI